LITFVTVGNATQPFDRLLRAVAAVTALLPKPVVVQRGRSEIAHPDWEIHDFVDMDRFVELVEQSRLLIMHGGVGSLINAIAAKKRPIVMPRRVSYGEHVDDHQVEFCKAFSEIGYLTLCIEPGDLLDAIKRGESGSGEAPKAGATDLVVRIRGILNDVALP
jgi:UDP-N-acetylglucosamine transferase subunit ALG13